MSKNGFIDNVKVGSPCSEDWNKMRGNSQVRMCDHCVKEVSDLSTFTRKDAKRMVRASDGNICIRYMEHPVTKRPIFADQFHQITRRAPGIAAGVITASMSLSTMAYAQGGATLDRVKIDESATVTKIQKDVVTETKPDSSQSDVKTNETTTNEDPKIVDLKIETDSFPILGGLMVARREHSTLLARAVDDEDIETVRELISRGENVNGKDAAFDNITPIFIAVENGSVEILQALLDAGAKVNVRSRDRQTALMRLDSDATPELVNLLIRYGTKLNLIDNDGNTALILAAENASTEVIEALIRNGADVNLGNKEGVTPLMNAAERGDIESVRLLLNSGAIVNAKDKDGDNAWEYADEKEIQELLVTYGAESRFVEPEGNYDDEKESVDQEKPAEIVINY